MDRNVLWLLRLIPELEDDSASIDEERPKIAFNSNPTSYQIVMFHS